MPGWTFVSGEQGDRGVRAVDYRLPLGGWGADLESLWRLFPYQYPTRRNFSYTRNVKVNVAEPPPTLD